MGDPRTKQEMLELIHSEREALEALLARLREEQLTQLGVVGEWSVKDILVHIAVWEERMRGWVAESLRGEASERPAPGMTWDDLDRLNEQTYLANKDRPMDEVREMFQASYRTSLHLIASLAQKDLFDADRFGWRAGDPLWHLVAANTCWHYKEHREDIEKWIQADL
jgi:hypothetical protein